jgi:uncharacterized membrane protein
MERDIPPILPAHVEDSVQAIAEVHARHDREAGPVQRGIGRLTAAFGQPAFVVLITMIVLAWVGINVAAPYVGRVAFDPSPFSLLQAVASVAALYMTVLILTTQRHADRLADNRAQLTLQLALINEQKTAKLIGLMEDLRRDHPDISNRIDPEALAMAQSADPQHVLELINERHDQREA